MAKGRYCTLIVLLLLSDTITLRHVNACTGLNDTADRNKTTFVMVGSSTELSCFVSNVDLAAWVLTQKKTPDYVTLGTTILQSGREQFALNMSNGTNEGPIHVNILMYNLIIRNVTKDVEGIYTCKQEGCDIMNVILSTEVSPILWMEAYNLNVSNTLINVTQDEDISITCKAVGGKPEVFLTWKVNGQNQTHGVTSESISREVSSVLQYRPKRHDNNVTCRTNGQITAPSVVTFVNINVLYPPTCKISLHMENLSQYRVTCICDANPSVITPIIFVDNHPNIGNDTILLSAESAADIYCRAENAVGSYETPFTKYYPADILPDSTKTTTQNKSDQQYASASTTVILLAFSVTAFVAAVVVIAFLFFKRMTTTRNTRNENDGIETNIQHYYHMPVEQRDVSAKLDENYASHIYQECNTKHNVLEQ